MFLLLFGGISFTVNIFSLLLYGCSINTFSSDALAAMLATNPDEIQEYMATYVTFGRVLLVLSVLSFICILFYVLNRIKFKIKVFFVVMLFVFTIFSLSVAIYKFNDILRLNVVFFILKEPCPDLRDYRQNPQLVINNEQPENIVMLIGESFSKSHSSLYGYEKNTNPCLATMQSDSLLDVYKNVTSYTVTTIPSIKSILTSYIDTYADSIKWYECLTIIDIVKNAGYKTFWISNQSKRGLYDNEVGRFADLCDKEYFVGDKSAGMNRKNLDEELLHFIKPVVDGNTGKKFFIIQMMGSHSNFKFRYPQNYSIFDADDYNDTYPQLSFNNKQLLAEYDNSILYNDSVVCEIMRCFADEEAVVFYFSDHAIDVFQSSDDYIGHASLHGDPVKRQYACEIPFMIHTTDKFKRKFSQLERNIKQSVDVPYRTDSIMYTIMDVAGIDSVNGVSYKHKSILNR